MSVFTVLWLDCNGEGCTARFTPSPPISLAPALREAAAAAGWRPAERSAVDHCPRCAAHVAPDAKWTKGICPYCEVEHVVRTDATMTLHTRKERDIHGRRIPCDGSGLPPQRITTYGKRGRQPYPGWKESA